MYLSDSDVITIKFLDTLTSRLEVLDLELNSAYWDNNLSALVLEIHDLIAKEDNLFYVDQEEFNEWMISDDYDRDEIIDLITDDLNYLYDPTYFEENMYDYIDSQLEDEFSHTYFLAPTKQEIILIDYQHMNNL